MDDSLTTVLDSGGYTMKVKEFDGMLWPPYIPGNVAEQFGAIRNLPGRHDDVVIATYAKSGRCIINTRDIELGVGLYSCYDKRWT
jgi:hypothetical protein